jgi:uncharacterized membrane protein/uncharacterized protein YbjT (DUF2867 family)
VPADFTRDHDPALWLARLDGIDAVVNAVGILREQGAQTFSALHVRAPRALFAACVRAGVRRVVQVSALGADAQARSAYHLTKRDADEFLLQQRLSAAVVQPSLVYGAGGASARLFNTLAALPLVPLPGRGGQQVQPIHIDDLTGALLALLTHEQWRTGRIALVGPQPLTLRVYLGELRSALGLPPAPHAAEVPMPLVRAAARSVGRLPGVLLDRDALEMLERGSVADVASTRALLGHAPRPSCLRAGGSGAAAAARGAAGLAAAAAARGAGRGVDRHRLGVAVCVSARREPRAARTQRRAGVAAAADAVGRIAARSRARRGHAGGIVAGHALAARAVVVADRVDRLLHRRHHRAPAGFWAHPYGPVLKNVVILAVLVAAAGPGTARARHAPMSYLVAKWLHVLSSTLLFGTGLGTAFYMFAINRSGNVQAIAVMTRWVVRGDWLFTATTVVFQPLSGLYLMQVAGYPMSTPWLAYSWALFFLAGACWLPVVWIQMRMRDLAQRAAADATPLPDRYWQLERIWVALGFPAFFGLVAVFWLMVAKPS